ncbi:hypothetical protein JW707_02760 [Candidatus Woesearchaeota archaeon]|nr:hypothetical protein [Candidatus Woesearchaeota archaeon]
MRNKVYGSYRIDRCPFCSRQAVTKNDEGVPVCSSHREQKLPDLKCICGDYLDLKTGKFGAYFSCFRCGNVSWQKAKSYNQEIFSRLEKGEEPAKKQEKKGVLPLKQEPRKEIVVTSDELDLMF